MGVFAVKRHAAGMADGLEARLSPPLPFIVGIRFTADQGLLVAMNVEDYYQNGKQWRFRLHEKSGKRHDVPAHHNALKQLPVVV